MREIVRAAPRTRRGTAIGKGPVASAAKGHEHMLRGGGGYGREVVLLLGEGSLVVAHAAHHQHRSGYVGGGRPGQLRPRGGSGGRERDPGKKSGVLRQHSQGRGGTQGPPCYPDAVSIEQAAQYRVACRA